MRYLLLCCLLFSIPAYSEKTIKQVPFPLMAEKPYCGDFLALIDKKPEHLEFIECVPGKRAQLNALFAVYRVAGKDAANVEAFFIKQANMQPLVRVCCVWESVPDKEGQRYGYFRHDLWKEIPEVANVFEISMDAEESLHNKRTAWKNIPWFYVDVIFLLESP